MPEKRNLLVLFPDQLRHDFLGLYGARFVDTPNIDALAERGVVFGRAYSQHPVCVAARTSLLTGLHAVRTGVLDNGMFLRPDLAACGIATWAETLAASGYQTAAIGKMHFYPWDLSLGFGYRSVAEDKRWIHVRDDYYHYLRAHGHRKYHGNEHEGYHEDRGAVINLLPWEHQVDRFVGQEAVRYIREYGNDGPFAMMVGFPGPHCPYDPAPEFLAGLDPAAMPPPVPNAGDTPGLRAANVAGNLGAWNGVDYSEFTLAQKLKIRAHYAALVRQIDTQVGEIVAALRERGLYENTAIVFASDHGDYLGDHDLIGKGHFFESSIHVPLLVHLPWAEGSTVVDDPVTLTDVTATLLALAGEEVPTWMDSRPLPGLGLPNSAPRERIVGALAGGWMIQERDWRLAKYETGEATLFDLEADPDEQRNLIADPTSGAVLRDLDAKLTREIMALQVESHYAARVYVRDLSQTPAFGHEGWQRRYPRPVGER